MAAEVTESLPNLKMSTPPKMVDALKATHTVLKAIWRQKPDFVMKRTDAIYPVLTFNRLTAEFRSSLMSRLPILTVSGAVGAKAISCPDSLWNTAIAGVASLRHSCGVSDQPSPSDEENVFQLSAVSRVQRRMAMKSPGVESPPKIRQKMQSISRRGGFSWIWWVVLLALLGGGAWAFWFLRKKEDAPKYLTAPAKRMDITSKVTATGTLSAVVSVQVGSQISGNILKLLADFNTPVKAGQVVAELDPATFQANVHLADGDLATAQAGKELAELTSKRTGELFSQRLVAQAERDKAVADLHQAEAVVAVKHAALERAKIDLARCTIVAPVDGIVISRNVDVGQTVAAAMTAADHRGQCGDLRDGDRIGESEKGIASGDDRECFHRDSGAEKCHRGAKCGAAFQADSGRWWRGEKGRSSSGSAQRRRIGPEKTGRCDPQGVPARRLHTQADRGDFGCHRWHQHRSAHRAER